MYVLQIHEVQLTIGTMHSFITHILLVRTYAYEYFHPSVRQTLLLASIYLLAVLNSAFNNSKNNDNVKQLCSRYNPAKHTSRHERVCKKTCFLTNHNRPEMNNWSVVVRYVYMLMYYCAYKLVQLPGKMVLHEHFYWTFNASNCSMNRMYVRRVYAQQNNSV